MNDNSTSDLTPLRQEALAAYHAGDPDAVPQVTCRSAWRNVGCSAVCAAPDGPRADIEGFHVGETFTIEGRKYFVTKVDADTMESGWRERTCGCQRAW